MGKRAHLPGIPAWFRRALAPIAAPLRRLAPITPAKAAIAAAALAALAVLAVLVWPAGGGDQPAAVAQPSPTPTARVTPGPTPKAPPKTTPTVTHPAQLPVSELTIGPGQTARYFEGLYRVTPDGAASLITTRSDQGGSVGVYSISHDERRIAFPERGAVYAKDLGGSDPARFVASLDHVWSVELSPTGDQAILYARLNGSEGSFLLDMTTGSYARFQPEGLIMRGAVWSPDGSRIAFIAGPHEATHTYVASPDGTGLRQVSNGHGFIEWSPDGRSITLNGLVLLDLETGQSNTLSSVNLTSGPPSWSVDGRRLVFSASHQDGTYVDEIHLIDLQSKQETIVPAGSAPALSADGSKIAFTRDGNLFLVNADGSGERQLIFPTQPFAESPTWLADDSLIFNFSPLGAAIYVINPDGSGEIDIADGFSPEWSPDGALIAFDGGGTGPNLSGRTDIYLMHPDGGGIRKVNEYNWDDLQPSCEGSGVSWAPDGTALIHSDGTDGHIRIVTTDGNSSSFDSGFSPAWSPDGRSIAFIDPDIAYPCSLYVAPAGDPGAKRVVFGLSAQSFAWSPDSQRIAFSDGKQLFTGQVESDAVRILTSKLSDDEFTGPRIVSWSPEGTRVLYIVKGALYVIDAGGGTPLRVDRPNAPDEYVQSADWSPDSTKVAFAAAISDAYSYESSIYIADTQTGEIIRLTEGSDPDWSPDGTRIAFIR
jgi:Tol biopolymer transport system component